MYKEAAKQKLRIATSRGSLSVEQLWDLPLTELDALAVSLEESHKNSKGKSFLETRTTKDKGLKLQFDIVLDVLQSKVEDAAAAREATDNKLHNQKIDELIAKKKDNALEELSIKDLEKLRK